MKPVKLFVFDLDGVLTETSRQHYLAWSELAEEIGISFDLAFNETLKGVSRMDSLERILRHGGKENDFTMEEKRVLATRKNERYKEMISSFTKNDLFDGVLELLDSLRDRGIRIALGSASKNGPSLLRAMGIEEYFDYVVNPAEVRGKPHPDIFLKACTELNVDPAHAIGVEDAYSGIAAIKAAGMFAVGIGDPTILHEADIVYPTTKDIRLEDIL